MINKCVFLAFVLVCLSACNDEETTENVNESHNCETTDSVRKETVKLINEARSLSRQCGSEVFYPVPPVTWNDNLQKAAKKHSDDMANNNFFDHIGSDGSNTGDRIINQGYNWITYRENIFAGAESFQEAIDEWLKSAEHCANIMAPDVKEMGAACSPHAGTKDTTYWTQVFALSY